MALIRESGSTSRVLNLPLIAERHGETPEYKAKPLFRNPRLNTALILKHVVRPAERGCFGTAPINSTKIVLPFSSAELRLGGRSLFYGERNFERVLRDALGAQKDDLAHDLELLRLLDSLPSFDPFLLRERLRQSGYDPAQCYFEMSEADVMRMRGFVSKEIERLVALAYANSPSARELSARLAEKLMTDETAKPLDPLRQTLRLSPGEYREGVFAWRGFLYYKWVSDELAPQLSHLSREILAAKIIGAPAEDREIINDIRQKIVDHLGVGASCINEAINEYAVAFSALAEGHPAVFREFLLKAPSMFVPIGQAVGVIQHVHSFWRFRFPVRRIALTIPADDALDMFVDLEATLGGMDVIADAASADRFRTVSL
ncbi:MAG: hypothetical protein JNJ73_09110 [Hyphomonadaceae bacterium]|nr:hypothetical protein [Hyphomonadaceae bacterium]